AANAAGAGRDRFTAHPQQPRLPFAAACTSAGGTGCASGLYHDAAAADPLPFQCHRRVDQLAGVARPAVLEQASMSDGPLCLWDAAPMATRPTRVCRDRSWTEPGFLPQAGH